MKAENPGRAGLQPAGPHSLARAAGHLWRALEEYRNPPDPDRGLDHELGWRLSEALPQADRREFGKLMAAALAMAGLSGCTRQPLEKIVPYVRQPNAVTQDQPLFFATAMPFGGDAIGLVVKSHMGRPIKIEGNPRHPASLGSTDLYAQASLYGMYDPDRSQTVLYQGRISSWVSFVGAMGRLLAEQEGKKGAGLRLLTPVVTSPTLGGQIQAFLGRYPGVKWYQWEPVVRGATGGARMAFGVPVNTYYRFDQADVILAVDADFLFCGPGNVRYGRDFVSRRGGRAGDRGMNRLYAVESSPTNTGAAADHRLPLRNSDLERFLVALAGALGVAGLPRIDAVPGVPERWLPALVKDLERSRGKSIVVVGDTQPARMHALAHAINAALGNPGATVVHTEPVEVSAAEPLDQIRELTGEMSAGAVETLIVIGTNPVYDAPADLEFEAALGKVRNTIGMALYVDETAAKCAWHIPQTHFLEEWSDCRAYDGTASIVQPLIAPLYNGRSPHELLSALTGQPDTPAYEVVRSHWREWLGGGSQRGRGRTEADFEQFWTRALHDGIVEGTALPPTRTQVSPGLAKQFAQPRQSEGLEIAFRPDPAVWDGRFANNSYLQELPKPITTLTWDAAAYVSPNTAGRLGVQEQDLVELRYRGRTAPFPVLIVPGQADDCVTVLLGYGRRQGARRLGFNAYPLRTSDAPWWDGGLSIRKTGERYRLAMTQLHKDMAGRFPVRMGTLGTYEKDPHFAHKHPFEPAPRPSLTLYPEWRYEGYKWGMAIDLNACVGCQACVVACDLENNIPVVGKNEVLRGREMHWLRIDNYYQGSPHNPRVWFQPVLCMHCENAPCELVCPVNATVHSSEGLNQMVYNRCVGTRYCSNNCPYKVRRFNFFLYSDWASDSLTLMRNPEVTVRSRGVMEKCTYCVQRIQHAKIEAEKEDRPIRDGDVKTACQQACPTEAIVFGDLNNKESRVFRMKKQPLDYGLLDELNTRPRTTYLARIVNLNPEIEPEPPHHG